jgi:hypothetical protein
LNISRSSAALPPSAFMQARLDEWAIENGLHYVLDVSGDADRRLWVRTLNHLCVLALLGRNRVALWRHSQRERERRRRPGGSAQNYPVWLRPWPSPLLKPPPRPFLELFSNAPRPGGQARVFGLPTRPPVRHRIPRC